MSATYQAGFRLRPMRSEDVPEVHALEEDIFPTPWSLKSYRFEVEHNPASEPLVVEARDGRSGVSIAAYIVPWLLVDEVHIANIAVAPRFRRLGLARRLLQHVLRRAARAGACSASLEVRAGNGAAQALYRGMGFEVVGRRKRYYRDNGEDALLMRLESLEPMEEELPMEVF